MAWTATDATPATVPAAAETRKFRRFVDGSADIGRSPNTHCDSNRFSIAILDRRSFRLPMVNTASVADE